ncbi:hypothetical protein CCY99_00325 [Helicobacter sp. 16-1353]|uniref:metal-dependent hydrolase family protein n=1 Tax=Helicobacter sp. 16-1353 TaxID=2004996 RepID=UPI000DCBF73E|nr:amidohydrolase family protein [Helicobacter sp. 16-1353]RAX55178.1 hypothetical protein CCY99_00325 [Helicobacter sp. 16-1353]
MKKIKISNVNTLDTRVDEGRRKSLIGLSALGILGASATLNAHWGMGAVELTSNDTKDSTILIKNAVVFDGYNQMKGNNDVLIKNNKIAKIGQNLDSSNEKNVKVINANGKFLMPGLIDAHWHTMLAAAGLDDYNQPDNGLVVTKAVAEAENTVLRGFTTVRDMAGGVFGMKKAFDDKVIPGPRIFPSGAFVSQTSGHGDMRAINNPPSKFGGVPSVFEQNGDFVLADGIDDVTTAVRWQLKKGASQIKIGGGGGVISKFDPLDSLQYTTAEMKAAVSAASDYGTYVCAHLYYDNGINRAVDAGIMSIEHGQFAKVDTLKKMADKGVWLSTQAFETNKYFPKPDSPKGLALDGAWRKTVENALKVKCNIAFGTDMLFSPFQASGQNYMLYLFSQILGNLDALRLATSTNAKLLELCGERNPYYGSNLGVIKEGAWADLILVDGNPINDFKIIYDYDNRFDVIIKDGAIIKNKLA